MIDFLFDRSRWASELKPVGICAGAVGKKNLPPLISWQTTLAKPVMVGHHPSRKNSGDGGTCLPEVVLRESLGWRHGSRRRIYSLGPVTDETVVARLSLAGGDVVDSVAKGERWR